jgi:xanthine/CO dehydrogenase XdhC/CoxF family maturation factor
MSELKAIVGAAAELRKAGKSFLCATVVRASGAAFRRLGARVLIHEARRIAGSITGGALERHVVEGCLWRATEGEPVLASYDARADEATRWCLAIGGGDGAIEVLVERLGQPQRVDPLLFIEACLVGQRRGALVTVIRSAAPEVQIGARVSVAGDGTVVSEGLGEVLRARIVEDTRVVVGAGAPQVRTYSTYGEPVEALVEPIHPPPRLFVIGADHDALPLVEIGRTVGWDVVVCDPLARWATCERFVGADEVLLTSLDDVSARISASDRAMAVVMGHDYDLDRAALAMLLGSRARYIGVMGPRRRTAQMLVDLGRALGDDDRVRAPVGLALGADTPQEHALAIVAEIQGFIAYAAAASLRAA